MKDESPEYLNSEATLKAKWPFSEAVRVGNMLYLSGVLPVKPGTMQLIEGDIKNQTQQVMENIKTILERNGSSMKNVIKCTVMMTNMKEWPDMNSVYITYFDEHFPARSAIGASSLALGAKIEIECMAMAGKQLK